MPVPNHLITHNYFPASGEVPFGPELTKLFFDPPKDNGDFMIHGPNVIRLTRALLSNRLDAEGLLLGPQDEKDRTSDIYLRYFAPIHVALEMDEHDREKLHKMEFFMAAAAMYHDVGKTIRRANHPQIGANLLRNFDQAQSNRLVKALQYPGESDDSQSKHHRFSLICSTTQHHDKFGVVSTGEGALPIFSDILYFTSNEKVIDGIVKNVTAVMLLNLGDIAAVVPVTLPPATRDEAARIAKEVVAHRAEGKKDGEEDTLRALTAIITNPACCLGLKPRKVWEVLSDWQVLVSSIRDEGVLGNRGRLKQRLLYLEQNPARTIQRILRLLTEATDTCNARVLSDHMSQTLVESVLVGALGSHHFQTFCRQFAAAVKLDYALNFFKAIVCAVIRKALKDAGVLQQGSWNALSAEEAEMLATLGAHEAQNIVNEITSLFIKVLHGIMTRYAEALEAGGLDARRFGFQMRDLTSDEKIREAIITLLCRENAKDHIALTWIADEVTIWSMD